MAPATDFLLALRRELDEIRKDYRKDYRPTIFALLENHNLGHYANSELAWTMNRNHLLPQWRLRV